MTLTEAYAVFGLPFGTDLATVKLAYRRLVLRAHPDQGGEVRDFIIIQAAYELIREFFNAPYDGEFAIPNELREIIDQLEIDFRGLADSARYTTEQNLTHLWMAGEGHLRFASRRDLRRFGEAFFRQWNDAIRSMFYEFDRSCAGLLWRYDSWFIEATRQSLCSEACRPLWIRNGVAQATPFEPMSLELFQVTSDTTFLGSWLLRDARVTTASLGVTGSLLVDLVTEGIGGPIAGAAVGLAIGEIVDRVTYPTEQIRAMLIGELSYFMQYARQQTADYVTAVFAEAASGLAERIVANYDGRVRVASRLISGCSGSAKTRYCRHCGALIASGGRYCGRCGARVPD